MTGRCEGCKKTTRFSQPGQVRCGACGLKRRRELAAARQSHVALPDPKAIVRTMPKNTGGLRILVIPDTQIGPGTPTDHLKWIGAYAARKQPDVIVHLGDHADMPSLCSYDRGKLMFEGRRYKADVDAAKRGMDLLLDPVRRAKGYKPRLVLTLGNHEERIERAIQETPVLDGTISMDDLGYAEQGWEVNEFLKPVNIEGVEFCHYFTSGPMKKAIGSAARQLAMRHGSSVAGHSHGFDMAVHPATQHTAIICGTCYLHDEGYAGPQGNAYRRQVIMLNEVKDGRFDPMFVSLGYLERRFGK